MKIHWVNLLKTAGVLAAIALLAALKVDVPPALLAMGSAVVAGALPGWIQKSPAGPA